MDRLRRLWPFLLPLCLGLTACGQVPLHPENPTFETFACDFESGDWRDYRWTDSDLAGAHSLVIVASPVRAGARAASFTVNQGDQPSTGTRAELGLSDLYPHGTEVFYGWSVFIDPASVDTDKWQLLGQWHDAPDPLLNEDWSGYVRMSPPLSVLYKGGAFLVSRRSTTLWGAAETIASVAVPKGSWIDVLFHVRWSTDGDGFVHCRVNGTPVTGSAGDGYRVYGRNLRNMAGNFLRLGIYRDDTIPTPLTVTYDEVKVGRTLAEVQP